MELRQITCPGQVDCFVDHRYSPGKERERVREAMKVALSSYSEIFVFVLTDTNRLGPYGDWPKDGH